MEMAEAVSMEAWKTSLRHGPMAEAAERMFHREGRFKRRSRKFQADIYQVASFLRRERF